MPNSSLSLPLHNSPIDTPVSLMARGLWGAAALASLAVLLLWLPSHPLGSLGPTLALALYTALLIIKPQLWLIFLPLLWPVADLSVWSGRIHFTETDALTLATLAALGLRRTFSSTQRIYPRSPLRLSLTALTLFTLLLCSYAASTFRTFSPAAFDLNNIALYAGYLTPLNGVRLAKGLLLAVILLPCLHLTARQLGPRTPTWLAIGLAAGLASASLAVIWERIAFTGLSNFSSDYRTTGLFWEMNTGGAALDGWLSITFPFAVFLLLRERRSLGTFALAILCALASYATFTTFSRGLYGGIVAGLLILAPSFLSHQVRQKTENTPHLLITLTLLGIFAGGAALVFDEGGYRATAAWIGFTLLLLSAGDTLRSVSSGVLIVAAILGGILALVAALTTFLIPKGAYISYALLWLSAAVFLVRLRNTIIPAGISTQVFALACVLASGISLILISLYWGGGKAISGAVAAVLLGTVTAFIHRQAPKPLWTTSGSSLIKQAALAATTALIIIGSSSYYVTTRFSTVNNDLAGRIEHWQTSASLVQTTLDNLVGIGTGRYASAYFWQTPAAAYPGTLEWRQEENVPFLRLGGPHYVRGFGELVRISQRIPDNSVAPFQINIRARASGKARIHVEICRRNLLYPQDCAIGGAIVSGDKTWQSLSFKTGKTTLNDRDEDWYAPRPMVLSIANDSTHIMDITDLWVTDAYGREIIRNGNFVHGTDRWLLTSDRHHLPWHAKNFLLHVWIEQGLLGLIPMLLAFTFAAIRLVRHYNNSIAPALLAALTGFFIVGLFDSLLDVPRLGTFLFLLLWVSLSLRTTNKH